MLQGKAAVRALALAASYVRMRRRSLARLFSDTCPMLSSLAGPPEQVETNTPVSDEVKTTTCYMCACRCGIRVHLKGGDIRFIEGNRKHPINKGVLCAKGSAGIMQHLSPARLSKPLRRVGPRGSGEFEEIEWEEALRTATQWLSAIRNEDPKKLAFFTGRDQSQSLTGFWAQQFGTPNFAAHGGFCSVNMAAGGIYSVGGSFWEFGEPDWEHTKYLMMFGVAEDHDSNPIKIGIGALKSRGGRVIAVNPVRTGYNAVADEWVGITPGTDGLFVLAMCHELLRTGHVDVDYLARWTNAGWLVSRAPGAGFGIFVRDADGKPLVRHDGRACAFGVRPKARGAGPRWRPLSAGLRADGAQVPRPGIRAQGGCRPLRRAGADDPADRRRARRHGLQPVVGDRRPLDRFPRRTARDRHRATRQLPRHARRLGAFQRLPDLPGDPRPAASARRRRAAPSASSRPIPSPPRRIRSRTGP